MTTSTTSAAGSIRDFTVDLYRAVAGARGNVVLSPYSAAVALGMTLTGARGETAEQIGQVLHTRSDAGSGIGALGLELVSAAESDADVTIDVANSVWAQQGLDWDRQFLAADVPVAVICGATAGLALAGLLDDRRHTSAAPEYLAATGYSGGSHYVADAPAVADRGLVTAGPQAPVQFAAATLGLLGLASPERLEAYVGVFHRADPAAYPALLAPAA